MKSISIYSYIYTAVDTVQVPCYSSINVVHRISDTPGQLANLKCITDICRTTYIT